MISIKVRVWRGLARPWRACYGTPTFGTLTGTPTMPKPRAARLETAPARRKLPVRESGKPYYVTVSPTIQLGYRRNEGPGTWSVRVTSPAEWVKKIALADDLETADGRDV